MSVRIAFYAPLKAPDHPVPSGDRTVARLLVSALRAAGYDPEVASALRTFDRHGASERQRAIREAGGREADRLVGEFRRRPVAGRPRLWFTYHCYYRSPDWIGPAVANALAIPYVVAEPSRAGKRASGPWAIGHEGAEAALDRADLLLATTPADREALDRARPPRQRIADLPPFLDLAEWAGTERLAGNSDPRAVTPGLAGPAKRAGESPEPTARTDAEALPDLGPSVGSGFSLREPRNDGGVGLSGPTRLLAVAMMREGDKLASYRELAAALVCIPASGWTLDIVGDGPARAEVEALFAGFGERVTIRGAVEDRAHLASLYAASDLLVWPAVNEAYGMALLEAQAFGCPVLAGRHGGVASVVQDGVTGRLVAPGDVDGFARTLSEMIADRSSLAGLGEAARRFVHRERDLPSAAAILRRELRQLDAPALAA